MLFFALFTKSGDTLKMKKRQTVGTCDVFEVVAVGTKKKKKHQRTFVVMCDFMDSLSSRRRLKFDLKLAKLVGSLPNWIPHNYGRCPHAVF